MTNLNVSTWVVHTNLSHLNPSKILNSNERIVSGVFSLPRSFCQTRIPTGLINSRFDFPLFSPPFRNCPNEDNSWTLRRCFHSAFGFLIEVEKYITRLEAINAMNWCGRCSVERRPRLINCKQPSSLNRPIHSANSSPNVVDLSSREKKKVSSIRRTIVHDAQSTEPCNGASQWIHRKRITNARITTLKNNSLAVCACVRARAVNFAGLARDLRGDLPANKESRRKNRGVTRAKWANPEENKLVYASGAWQMFGEH